MGTIYATTPVRSPPVPPNTGGRKISVEKTVQFAGSIIYEDREVELEVSYLMLDCINCLGDCICHTCTQPSVCTMLVEQAEALQHPQTGIQMQERRVVNQTKRVFSGNIV